MGTDLSRPRLFGPIVKPERCCIRLNEGRPCSSSATISPSSTASLAFTSLASACSSGNSGVNSFWLRETSRIFPFSMKATARYPSHLISNSQSSSLNGSSTSVASIGWIARGIADLRAPESSEITTPENAEGAEDLLPLPPCTSTGATRARASFFLELLAAEVPFDLDDFVFFASSASCAVLVRFLSATAMLLLSQSDFRGAAFRLLSHSADPSSAAICSSERLLSTDQSIFFEFASNPACTPSSRFLISNHSVPLLPGRRERMCASTNSPFNFFPSRRNFKSPFASIWCGSPNGSHVPTSQTCTVPAP